MAKYADFKTDRICLGGLEPHIALFSSAIGPTFTTLWNFSACQTRVKEHAPSVKGIHKMNTL